MKKAGFGDKTGRTTTPMQALMESICAFTCCRFGKFESGKRNEENESYI
jgi:hypothetical protein